jgi:hypothetical protein
MERIHELIDELMEEILKAFPTATNARITVDADGYRSLAIERIKEDDDLPVEAWKRRELFVQHKLCGSEWSTDRSEEQNRYYRERKLLLEEE